MSKPASDNLASNEALQPADYYMEGPYVVFTAAYHLRRGYCCNSDCRHCPYKESNEQQTQSQP
jgi:2-iminoacetate synthase ThiH